MHLLVESPVLYAYQSALSNKHQTENIVSHTYNSNYFIFLSKSENPKIKIPKNIEILAKLSFGLIGLSKPTLMIPFTLCSVAEWSLSYTRLVLKF